ncbi:MAG: hypothetical protein NC302_00425 [Bacteroidales bacterium]|nr:hypothetical protein [Bacteroidales bacterium]MCM1414371.1 hypothetical protein [bacterium]MCM1424935.1 hypothetical protein [bacterium]
MGEPLIGVYTAKRKDGTEYFRASLTYRNKHISLGSHPLKEAAHAMYLTASALLKDNSLHLEDYREDSPLAFSKWVTLVNFRDNGIYLAAPIYIRPHFFYYYFSPADFFIFDKDDLFYYASRRISRRGGHYFVADYGMQVNILNRYGIKSYAVEGRDYRFINGNHSDMRYENIEIINRFHGVQVIQEKGKTRYQVKIHVKGNVKVGVYDSEAEAAVAYNKAIDLLKKAGIDKAYLPNYMENLSPDAYAELYASVRVSPRLSSYRSE